MFPFVLIGILAYLIWYQMPKEWIIGRAKVFKAQMTFVVVLLVGQVFYPSSADIVITGKPGHTAAVSLEFGKLEQYTEYQSLKGRSPPFDPSNPDDDVLKRVRTRTNQNFNPFGLVEPGVTIFAMGPVEIDLTIHAVGGDCKAKFNMNNPIKPHTTIVVWRSKPVFVPCYKPFFLRWFRK